MKKSILGFFLILLACSPAFAKTQVLTYPAKTPAWVSQPSDLSVYLADAPSNGSTYARKNAAWVTLPSETDPVFTSWKASTSLSAGYNTNNNVANAVVIGNGATAIWQGNSSPNPISAVALGYGATAYGNFGGVIIGAGAHDSQNTGANGYNVVIGGNASGGSDNDVVIGNGASSNQYNNVVIGKGASANGYSGCIIIGYGAVATANNQTVIAGAAPPAWVHTNQIDTNLSGFYNDAGFITNISGQSLASATNDAGFLNAPTPLNVTKTTIYYLDQSSNPQQMDVVTDVSY